MFVCFSKKSMQFEVSNYTENRKLKDKNEKGIKRNRVKISDKPCITDIQKKLTFTTKTKTPSDMRKNV